MPSTPQAALRAFWRKRGIGNVALLPFSLLFLLAVSLRKTAYRLGLAKSQRAKVPVIVAGCLTAGGGGKTTLVIAIVNGLKKRGVEVGVISRGHMRSEKGASLVQHDDDPVKKGDEAVMVASVTRAPVAVSKNRIKAASLLLEKNPGVQVIVSDDGLQHLALERDVELVVLSEKYRLGNGWPLPAGPLREGPSRLNSVDAIVVKGKPGKKGEHGLGMGSAQLAGPDGKQVPVDGLKGKNIVAVAGIAEPESFFADLREHDIELASCIVFPDHHPYRKADLEKINADHIVMTEKDEIKCKRLKDRRILVFKRAPTLDPKLLDKLVEHVNEARAA